MNIQWTLKWCASLSRNTASSQFLRRWTEPERGKMCEKRRKNINNEGRIFPVIIKIHVKLLFSLCGNVGCVFCSREKQAPVTTQSCSVLFHLHIFAPGWFQLRRALPGGVLLLLLLSPRASRTHCQRGRSTPVPASNFKIKPMKSRCIYLRVQMTT